VNQPQFTLKEYLTVFNLVISRGKKLNGYYHFNGVKAWHDFDGYTCFLGYKDLTLTLLFHGRHSYDYEQKESLNTFCKLLTDILKDKMND